MAEAEFHDVLHTRVNSLEWRSAITPASLADYLANEARSADLVITKVGRSGSLFVPSRHVNMGDLVMRLGRPILLVPEVAAHLKLERVVVGWQDTRETRRAVLDALPLLKLAAQVLLVEIAPEKQMTAAKARLADVDTWLGHHGIAAECLVLPCTSDDVKQLSLIAQKHNADLVVAGAYGHSRLREWVVGGVTRDLLLQADWCSLLSH